MKRPSPAICNMLWYQAIWFLAILGGGATVAIVGILLIWHLARSVNRIAELIIVVGCGSCGYLADTLFSALGIYQFPGGSVLPAPLWLLGLWLGFAGTLRHSLAYLTDRPLLLVIFGAVGAPLSYLAAARLGAVVFPYGNVATLILVSLTWVTLLPLFSLLCRHVGQISARQARPIHTLILSQNRSCFMIYRNDRTHNSIGNHNTGSRWIRQLSVLCMLLASVGAGAKSTDDIPSPLLHQYIPDASLVGTARMRVLLWDVYDARLFAPSGEWQPGPAFCPLTRLPARPQGRCHCGSRGRGNAQAGIC